MRPTARLPSAKGPEGAVAKYYLYRATMAAGFTTPIWYYYVKVNVESYALVGTIDAIWWAGLILFEIPTGVVGDRIGRRNSLLVASAMITVAQLAMVPSQKFVHFAVVFAFWALASTFESGTTDAWLYDTLKARMDEEDFARVKGRGNAIMYVVMGTTGIVGGYIADVWMPYAYLASAAVTVVSIPVLLSFPESTPGQSEADDGEQDDDNFTVLDALPVIRKQFSKPPLRSFVPYLGLFFGVYWGVNFFIQPFSIETLGLSVSDVGWMFGGFTAVAAVVSYNTDRIEEFVGIRRWFAIAPPVLGVLFVAIAFAPIAAIPVFFVMRASRGVMMPLANQYINDRVASVGRATVLSTAGMVYHVVTIPFELGAGRLADALGIVPTISLFGAILVAGSAIFFAVSSPFGGSHVGGESPAD